MGTLGYVLHRVSRLDRRGMHKRESFLWPSDASSDFGSACLALFDGRTDKSERRGSKVIGSSEQVHVVDALAMIGDEGRDSLR